MNRGKSTMCKGQGDLEMNVVGTKPRIVVFASMLILAVIVSVLVSPQANAKNSMRASMYKKIQAIQLAMDPVPVKTEQGKDITPEMNPSAVRALIDDFLSRSPNKYEQSLVLQYSASLHLQLENYLAAYNDYGKILELKTLKTERLLPMLHVQAQLAMQTEQWSAAIMHFEQWMTELTKAKASLAETPQKKGKPSLLMSQNIVARDFIMLAQSYAQLNRWPNVVVSMNQAFSLSEKVKAPESWYRLKLSALMAQLEQLDEGHGNDRVTSAWKELHQQAVDHLVVTVEQYSKLNYWRQLAHLYQGAGSRYSNNENLANDHYQKALTALHSAYVVDLLVSEQDYLWMLRLMMHQGSFHQAARIFEQALEQQRITDSERNLKLLADCWVMARAYPKAEQVLMVLIGRYPAGAYKDALSNVKTLARSQS